MPCPPRQNSKCLEGKQTVLMPLCGKLPGGLLHCCMYPCRLCTALPINLNERMTMDEWTDLEMIRMQRLLYGRTDERTTNEGTSRNVHVLILTWAIWQRCGSKEMVHGHAHAERSEGGNTLQNGAWARSRKYAVAQILEIGIALHRCLSTQCICLHIPNEIAQRS